MIHINDDLTLDECELEVVTSRSAGPGGQNVNKVETRVTVRFDVGSSPSLSEPQRQRICNRLGNRINKEGFLAVSAQDRRTQGGNREAAMARFAALLADALEEATPRKPTRPPRSVDRRRLETKRRRAEVKRTRTRPSSKGDFSS